MAQSEAQKMLDDLRKEYEAREEAESGTPIIKDGKEIIRTTGGIVYGWYCDGRPCKGWGGTTITTIDEKGRPLNIGTTRHSG